MSGEQKEVKLREMFKEHFSEKDIARHLNLSYSNAHYLRYKLLKQKKIARIAKGRYIFCISSNAFSNTHSNKSVPSFDTPLLEYIRASLRNIDKPFSITSCSLFNDFYPLSNYIVIYIEKGSADDFLSCLSSLHLDFVVMNDPTSHDIEILRTYGKKRDFIILREKTSIKSDYSLAPLEIAFVDYYFEVSRGKLPIENKAEEILDHILAHHTLNFSTMLRYAKDRGIRPEIEKMLGRIKVLGAENSEPSEPDEKCNVEKNIDRGEPLE